MRCRACMRVMPWVIDVPILTIPPTPSPHPPKPTNTLRPYFLGFGLLPAVAASLLPFFVGVGAYAMVFPLVRVIVCLSVCMCMSLFMCVGVCGVALSTLHISPQPYRFQ